MVMSHTRSTSQLIAITDPSEKSSRMKTPFDFQNFKSAHIYVLPSNNSQKSLNPCMFSEELVLNVEDPDTKATHLHLLCNTFNITITPESLHIKFKERKTSQNQRKHLPFIECILQKRGLETYRLVKEYEKRLGVLPGHFDSYVLFPELRKRCIQTAGVKDTKGKY